MDSSARAQAACRSISAPGFQPAPRPQPLHALALLWSNLAGRVVARAEVFHAAEHACRPDPGDIGLSKGPPMQSTPTLKEADPHDVFAIESVLAAHAHKAPPLAH